MSFDFAPNIAGALDLLETISPDSRLLQLKNLAQNNGVWAIPDGPVAHTPVLYEISIFGVHASALTIEELPRCWMKAAKATLEGSTRAGGMMRSAPDFSIVRSSGAYFVAQGDKHVHGPSHSRQTAEDAKARLIREARSSKRKCMTCPEIFMSEGPHNRLCTSCRSKTFFDGSA